MQNITKRETMKQKPNILFAQNFKEVRKNLGLNIQQMGTLLNVSGQQISKYEAGITSIPMNHIHHLSQMFDLHYDVFFEGMQPPPLETDIVTKIISIKEYTHRKRVLNALSALIE